MVEAKGSPTVNGSDNSPTIQQTSEPSKKLSKNQIEKEAKKLKRKQQQAITVLCKAEDKPYDQLVSDQPQKCLFVTHFGNGDEAD